MFNLKAKSKLIFSCNEIAIGKEEDISHEFNKKLLTPNEVNEMFKLTNQNPYIKDYTKFLIPPRGKKGKDFKKNEINNFISKLNSDVKKYVIDYLEVEDSLHIPEIAHKCACYLIKECYTPKNLKKDYHVLLDKLLDKRAEVIIDNQLKNEKAVESFKKDSEALKRIIKIIRFGK